MNKYYLRKLLLLTAVILPLSLGFTYAQRASTEWLKKIGGTGNDEDLAQKGLVMGPDGSWYAVGIYAAGTPTFLDGTTTLPSPPVTGGTSVGMYILKADPSGNVVWIKSVSETANIPAGYTYVSYAIYPGSIALDAGGNVYVTGGYKSTKLDFNPGAGVDTLGKGNTDASSYDVFVLKLNGSGDFQWVKEIRGRGLETGAQNVMMWPGDVRISPAGDVHATFRFSGSTGSTQHTLYCNLPDLNTGTMTSTTTNNYYPNIGMVKYTASGNFVWAKRFATTGAVSGGGSVANPPMINFDPHGNFYVSGTISGSASAANTIDLDPANNVHTPSSVYEAKGSGDVFMVKFDPSGEYLWSKLIATGANEEAYGAAVTENAIYLTGNFSSNTSNPALNFDTAVTNTAAQIASGGGSDVFVVRYGLDGSFKWVKRFGGNGNDRGRHIAAGSRGDLYVTGEYRVQIEDFDASTLSKDTLPHYSPGTNADVYTMKLDTSGNYVWGLGTGVGGSTSSSDEARSVIVHNGTYRNEVYVISRVPGGGSSPNTFTVPLIPNGSGAPAFTLNTSNSNDIAVIKITDTACEATTTVVNVTECDSFTLGTAKYTTSGTYTLKFANVIGCDSFVTLNLTINNSLKTDLVESACDSFEWAGQTYKTGGNYTRVFTAASGCDSTVTLYLALGYSTEAVLNETACGFYELDGARYTQSGTYPVTIPNTTGCDSVITLNLTINNVNMGVTLSGTTLQAHASGAGYQWIDCDNHNALISGATAQSYTPVASGRYAVVVTESGCSDTSSCHSITITDNSVGSLSGAAGGVRMYPNPAGSVVMIESDRVQSLKIYNLQGSLVMDTRVAAGTQSLNIDVLAPGVYIVKAFNDAGSLRTTVKLTKY